MDHLSSSASHHKPPGSLVLSPQQPFHWPQLKHFHLANHHSILNPQIGQCGISVALLGSTAGFPLYLTLSCHYLYLFDICGWFPLCSVTT